MINTLILRRILIGGIFASLLIPFISMKSLYFPWITGKAYFFRFLVEGLFFLWLILAVFDKSARPKKSCILWSFVAFMVIIFVANLNGLNPTYSFWSNFERMEGYVTLAHLLAFFLVIASVFNTKKIWDVFLNTLVGTTILHAFYAILQVSGHLKIGLSSDRIDGTFGNAIYLAAFMLIASFITLCLWMRGNKYDWAKYFYGSALFLQILTIFLTATRGTIIALFAGLFVALVLFVILEPKKKVLRNTLIGFVVASTLFATLVFGFKDSSIVQNTVSLRRMSEISLSSGTVQARIINWGIAWKGVKESPLLGYGQGNYNEIFDKHYDVRMWSQEQFFDRVHNLFFDWLIAGGFLGLISYLAILLSVLYYLWKKSSEFSTAEKSSLTALIVAYVIHTSFVFDNLTSYLLLFFFLAWVHSRVSKPIIALQKINLNKSVSIALTVILLIGLPFTVWAVNADSYLQNREIVSAIQPETVEKINDSRETFKRALGRDTFGNQEALMQLLEFTNSVLAVERVNKEIKQSLVDLSAVEIKRYIDNNSHDSRTMLIAGQFLSQTGNPDIALKFFWTAIEISPKKQFMYVPVAETYFQQGKTKEALEVIKKGYEINPENDLIWMSYVRYSLRVGDNALYTKLIEEAFATGQGQKVVALALNNLNSSPDNVQAYATLAVAYYRSGDSEKAIEILNELAEKFPTSKTQADLIIKKIEAGEPIF